MNCLTCGVELKSEFANWGTTKEPSCFDCGMRDRIRRGKTID